jgi:Ca2+-transporting ATPase
LRRVRVCGTLTTRKTNLASTESDQPWHSLPLEQVFARLGSGAQGLTSDAARERLERYGPNVLPRRPPPAWWRIALRQFGSPLIYILAAAGAVSAAIGHAEDALFIAVVLLLNAGIGGYQEWNAERSSHALQKLLHVRASVQRDGDLSEVDAEELTLGDVVWLESGNRVPADLRLMQVHGLEVDESLLTGESLAVAKDARAPTAACAPLAERLSMVHAGSSVTRGRAQGVVVATGLSTAVGELALDVLGSPGGRPPLLERMERFTRVVALSVLVAATAVALIGVFVRGYGASEMFLFGVALAVSAIPEGLPVALTVALSIAAARMAKRGVIVRRLAAVEGLGSCTLIASDKTGTLTCNELTVRVASAPSGREWEVTGEGYAPEGEVRSRETERGALERLARAAVLCNEGQLLHRNGAWAWHGDPTDVALLSFGHKLGLGREALLTQAPQVQQIAFEAEHRYAATFHESGGAARVYVKGAPERVLSMCALSDAARAAQMSCAEKLAERGFRVLALAEGAPAGPLDPDTRPAEPAGLEFLGLLGLLDPLRPGAREAVGRCREAGIAVSMITGDHPVTALAIARDLGLAESAGQVVTGRELETLSKEKLVELVGRVRVFARTTPRQKLELVGAAREAGHFVAVTGDGVNDAPALRHANIGVAMGRSGADVAREAAGLVITDDNFATIVAGVEEGRVAYDNVRKVVYLSASTGAAEVFTLGLAVATGWPSNEAGLAVLPLLPVQILWLNLVTNGIQDVALAFEPAEDDVLRRTPRPPRQALFDRSMIERTVVAAAAMSIVGFGAFVWMVEVAEWSAATSRNALLLLMVLFQNLHIGNCRSETRSIFALSPLRSPMLLGGTLLAFGLHLLAMHVPLLQRTLGLEVVGIRTFAGLFALALTIVAALELYKLFARRRERASKLRVPPLGART